MLGGMHVTNFAVLVKKIGHAIKEKMTPIGKRTYLGKPPEHIVITMHEGGKTVNWLTQGDGKFHNCLELGDVKPLTEEDYRVLLGG